MIIHGRFAPITSIPGLCNGKRRIGVDSHTNLSGKATDPAPGQSAPITTPIPTNTCRNPSANLQAAAPDDVTCGQGLSGQETDGGRRGEGGKENCVTEHDRSLIQLPILTMSYRHLPYSGRHLLRIRAGNYSSSPGGFRRWQAVTANHHAGLARIRNGRSWGILT
jgi:hypothetical protein